MPLRVMLPAVLAALAVVAPCADAAFSPPVELAHGDYALGASAATDAAGATTAILVGATSKRLLLRPDSLAPWPVGIDLPGDLGVPVGPVVAANGQGAVAAAWRLDKPKRYDAIAAMVKDPGGALSMPAIVSPADANGVRHPAVAVGSGGDAVLAYNTNTRANHLSMLGAVAVSVRASGGTFGAPVVVDDTSAKAPAVAIADDGRGIVAWVRGRRVWAASVDATAGTVGEPKAIAPRTSLGGIAVAVGPGGAATVAWVAHLKGRTAIRAVHRAGGGAPFPRAAQTVATTGLQQYVYAVNLAADETGRTTLGWSSQDYGPDGKRTAPAAGVLTATLAPSGRFHSPVLAFAANGQDCESPLLATRAGRTYVAWQCSHGTTSTVSASPLPVVEPTTILHRTYAHRVYDRGIQMTLGLDASGLATITTISSDAPDPTLPTPRRLLATTGR
jgi:hypothetical protein